MISSITIAIDAMGGDQGLHSTIPACIDYASEHPSDTLLIFSSENINHQNLPSNIQVIKANSSVLMTESAAYALRHRSDSTMAGALNAVAEGRAQICLSSGNTAALMALGYHILGTYEGLRRPAICKPIPTLNKHSYMLDLGANVRADPHQLLEFARLGSGLAKLLDDNASPKVALLNIGTEEQKGNQLIHQANELLSECPDINYVGYIEGDSIYSGTVDVIVCDGFVGNVALKVSEGVAKLALSQLKSSFKSSFYGRALGQFARPLLRKWRTQFDPARYNGACFLGLNGAVIKSHGSADAQSFRFAIEMASDFAKKQTTSRLQRYFQDS
ncbi:phosphate acyltransferase PlsX [Sessilibacter sp. MAH4]